MCVRGECGTKSHIFVLHSDVELIPGGMEESKLRGESRENLGELMEDCGVNETK